MEIIDIQYIPNKKTVKCIYASNDHKVTYQSIKSDQKAIIGDTRSKAQKTREILMNYSKKNKCVFNSKDSKINLCFYHIVLDNDEIKCIIMITDSSTHTYLNEDFILNPINDDDTTTDSLDIICDLFLQSIQQKDSITFMIGFNQSIGDTFGIVKVLKEVGYNQIQLSTKDCVETNDSKSATVLKHIQEVDILNKTYFIDSSICIYDALSKEQKQLITDNTVQSYINAIQSDNHHEQLKSNVYDISINIDTQGTFRYQKIDQNTLSDQKHKLESCQKEIVSINDDQEAYYILDAKNLNIMRQFVMEQHLVDQWMQIQQILQVPLSYVLYETKSSCLQYYLHIKLAREDISDMDVVSEQNIDKLLKINQIIESVDKSQQYKQQCYVAEGDFESMYPSIISVFNISPDTLVIDINDKSKVTEEILKDIITVQLNRQEEIPAFEQYYETNITVAYFYGKQTKIGVIPMLVDQLMTLRNSKQSNVAMKNCCKSILTSIYGLFGFRYSELFNPICMAAIAAKGKELCNAAKRHLELLFKNDITVIARHTDSCQFKIKNIVSNRQSVDIYDSIITKWDTLNDAINNEMNKANSNITSKFLFKFEKDKFSLVSLYSKNKNTQAQLICSYDTYRESILSNTNIKVKTALKGCFAWQRYPLFKQSLIYEFFTDILLKNAQFCNITSINESINKQEEYHQKQVKSQEYLLQHIVDYSINLKYSREDKRCQYLRRIFNVNNQCNIIYYEDEYLINQLSNTQCIIPIEYIDTKNIKFVQIKKTVKDLLQPIRQFFGSKQTNVDAPEPGYIRVRIEMPNIVKSGNSQFVQRAFRNIKLDQIQKMISDNPDISFHEIIYKKKNKMYFDIDSKGFKLKKEELIKCLHNGMQKILPNTTIPIHIANANKGFNSSYHVVIDIVCELEANKFLAEQLDIQLVKTLLNDQRITYTQKEEIRNKNVTTFFDLAVYRLNGSLRMINCVKITKYNEIEKRPFIIDSVDSTFNDFVLTYDANCTNKLDSIVFSGESPLSIYCTYQQISERDIDGITKAVNYQFDSQFKLTFVNNFINLQSEFHQEYMCIVCNKTHTNDNLSVIQRDNRFFVDCYSNRQRQNRQNQPIELDYVNTDLDQELDHIDKQSQDVVKIDKLVKTPAYVRDMKQLKEVRDSSKTDEDQFNVPQTTFVKQQYINFTIDYPTNYIISSMGTGKSQQMKKLLDERAILYPKETVLCISFRKTFTYEFKDKYNLISYLDIKGPLCCDKYPRLILQVDSLARYDTTKCPGILIVDEIESILEQLLQCKKQGESMFKFVQLLTNSKKVIIMDGLMEPKTIEYLNFLRNTDNFSIVYNQQVIKSDYNYHIHRFQKSQVNYIAQYIGKQVNDHQKKIYGMVTTKKYGILIQNYLTTKGIKSIFYNGDDDVICSDENGDQISQMEIKERHFSDVNTFWTKYQVVLHNSSVTAGISYDANPMNVLEIVDCFHEQVNIYTSGNCSSLAFFQGSHRVRHLLDKKVTTYLEISYDTSSEIYPINHVKQIYAMDDKHDVEQAINFDKCEQMNIWLQARKGAATKLRIPLLFKYLKSMDYMVHIEEDSDDLFLDMKFLSNQFNTALEIAEMSLSQLDVDMLSDGNTKKIELRSNPQDCTNMHIKQQKFTLKNLYNLSMEQINNCDEPTIKEMMKNQEVQELRRNIFKAFQQNYENTNELGYVNKLVSMYPNLRNTAIAINNPEFMQFYHYTQSVHDMLHTIRQINKNTSQEDIDAQYLYIRNNYIHHMKKNITKCLRLRSNMKPIKFINGVLSPFDIMIEDKQNQCTVVTHDWNQVIKLSNSIDSKMI